MKTLIILTTMLCIAAAPQHGETIITRQGATHDQTITEFREKSGHLDRTCVTKPGPSKGQTVTQCD
jgi:hypothetical protein